MATKNGNQLTVREKVDGIRSLLDKSREQIAMALPKHMTSERMLRVTMTAVQRTPELLDCEPRSLIGAIVQASQLGLEPDGILGHAYLVPFRNKKTGQKEVQLIPGYKGLVDLSRRSGQISTIYARCVFAKDRYDFHYGLEPRLDHTPADLDDPGDVVAAYAVCRLRDGGVQFEWLWRREIDKIRAQSKASGSGPWVTHFEEMAKKTALRRLCKLLPVSVEVQRLVALGEHEEAGLSQGMASIVDLPVGRLDAPRSLDDLAEESDDDQADEAERGEPVEGTALDVPEELAGYARQVSLITDPDGCEPAYQDWLESHPKASKALQSKALEIATRQAEILKSDATQQTLV